MDEIKIVFFDIDGTLVDMEKKVITPKTVEALRRLKERNIILCLATGRGPLTLPHFEGIEFDAFLTFNGSYCFNKEQTIFSNPLSPEDVQTLLRNATAIHRPVSIATKDRMVANGKDKELIDYYAVAQREIEISDELETLAREDVYQIMLGCHKEERPLLLQDVHRAKVAAWLDWAVDVIPADGGKGVGIEKMLAYYHLDKVSALAFGDGDNDIEMLQAVGHGVAMGNASDALKEVADEVCGSATEDGVYHYCLTHGLL